MIYFPLQVILTQDIDSVIKHLKLYWTGLFSKTMVMLENGGINLEIFGQLPLPTSYPPYHLSHRTKKIKLISFLTALETTLVRKNNNRVLLTHDVSCGIRGFKLFKTLPLCIRDPKLNHGKIFIEFMAIIC